MLLVAVQSLTYEGRAIAAGEAFEVRRAVEAAALTYQRKAKFAPKGMTLQTRDVTAEPESEPATESEPEPAPSRRRYRRRDLTAEAE